MTPPNLEGTLQWPGTAGGVEWGGGAVDPTTRTHVVGYSLTGQMNKLIPREEFNEDIERDRNASAGYSAMVGVPYGVDLALFMNSHGMPCWKQPYGEITACDLETGERLRKRPFCQIKRDGFDMPKEWGAATIGGIDRHRRRPDLHRGVHE